MKEFIEGAQAIVVILVAVVIVTGAIIGTVILINHITEPIVDTAESFTLISGETKRTCQVLVGEGANSFLLKCLAAEGE